MSTVDFYISIDGCEPRPVSVQDAVTFGSQIIGLQGHAKPLKTETTLGVAKKQFVKPPPGERIIDYATRAAASFNGATFDIGELRDRMIEGGWITKSKTPRDKANVVRSTIINRPDWIYDDTTQTWRYHPA